MIRITALAFFVATSFSVFAAEEATTKLDLAKGKQIAETVCVGCHGADGNSPTSANPSLAGQGSEYLFKQLTQFKSDDGKPAVRNNPIMSGMTAALSVEDMKSLAFYFSQQKLKPATMKNWSRLARVSGARATSRGVSLPVQVAMDRPVPAYRRSTRALRDNMQNIPRPS